MKAVSNLVSSKPIIVIVGPTASGKSALAMEVARKNNGEIIAADSRTIYKGLDIGTAKPTKQEQKEIRHYGLDLVDPSQRFSAAEFKTYAKDAISKIQSEGKVPIVVGGSGMYIDGLLYDFSFTAKLAEDGLDDMSLAELQQYAAEHDMQPTDQTRTNKRHLIGFIRRGGEPGGRSELAKNVLILGLDVPKKELHTRIEKRVKAMLDDGLEHEIQQVLSKWGKDAPGLAAPAYRAFTQNNRDEAIARFTSYDKQLAKRQITWFSRNKDIHWVEGIEQAEQLINDFLNKFATIDS